MSNITKADCLLISLDLEVEIFYLWTILSFGIFTGRFNHEFKRKYQISGKQISSRVYFVAQSCYLFFFEIIFSP